jgi:hypothetical protein
MVRSKAQSCMKRSRTRLGLVWLTLIAFGVQLGVAVLHHHSERGSGIAARAMTAGLCAPSGQRPCVPASHHDSDGCVLCWAAAVAANTLAPPLLELPTPTMVISVQLGTFDSLSVRPIHRDNFQARGPPSAPAA